MYQNVKIGDILVARRDRFKPNDPRISDLYRVEKIDFSGNLFLSAKPSKTDMIVVKNGDLVISGINVSKGAFTRYQGSEDAIATIHYSSYLFDETRIDPDYILLFMRSSVFLKALKEQVPGGIKTEIKPKLFLNLEIRIPLDLEEQQRIVADSKRLSHEIKRISDELSKQSELTDQLRQAILREAMQGKLVPQDPNDEPASELLKRIKAEKAQLIKEKKLKPGKELPPIIPEEIPYPIPENWTWCRLGDILINMVSGYAYKSTHFKKKGDHQVLRLGNIKQGYLKLGENPVYIDHSTALISSQPPLKAGQVVITMTGTRSKKDYCYSTLIMTDHVKDSSLLINQRISCLTFCGSVLSEFYDYALKVDSLSDQIFKTATGSANQANIGITALRNWILPLPPLSEQSRIVGMLTTQLSILNNIQGSLKRSEALIENLLRIDFQC